LRRAAEVFDEGAQSVGRLAAAIGAAKQADQAGRGDLTSARDTLESMLSADPFGCDGALMKEAHHTAMSGIDARVNAAQRAKDASQAFEREAASLGARARAARLSYLDSDPLEQ